VTDSPGRLDADLEAALRVERDRRGPGAEARQRVLRRVQASVATGGGRSGEGSPEPQGSEDQLCASAGESASITDAIWNAWKALKRAHPALVGGGGFALGVAVGVALHAAIVSSRLPAETGRSAVSSAPASSAAPALPAPFSPRPAPPTDTASSAAPSLNAKPALTPPALPSKGPAGKLDRATLAGERALLDLAHAALGRGDTVTALDALSRHTRQFPRGTYREEREALRVQCLRDMGKHDDARRAAASFAAQYPNSLFRSNVARGTIPNP
jgi:hypothetical protein